MRPTDFSLDASAASSGEARLGWSKDARVSSMCPFMFGMPYTNVGAC